MYLCIPHQIPSYFTLIVEMGIWSYGYVSILIWRWPTSVWLNTVVVVVVALGVWGTTEYILKIKFILESCPKRCIKDKDIIFIWGIAAQMEIYLSKATTSFVFNFENIYEYFRDFVFTSINCLVTITLSHLRGYRKFYIQILKFSIFNISVVVVFFFFLFLCYRKLWRTLCGRT